MLVNRLLIEQLGFEEIGHARGASAIVVAIQAEVLLSLFDAASGEQELLVRFLYPVPGVLHTDLQELGIVL